MFIIGEKVIVLNPIGKLSRLSYGKIGTIVSYDSYSKDYTVDFDNGGRWFFEECEISIYED